MIVVLVGLLVLVFVVLVRQLLAVLGGVPLPLLGQEIFQLAAPLQLLVLLR